MSGVYINNNGEIVTGYSGRAAEDLKIPRDTDAIQDQLDNTTQQLNQQNIRPNFAGGCSEPHCFSQAVDSGQLDGGFVGAANIVPSANRGSVGTPQPACPHCANTSEHFGVGHTATDGTRLPPRNDDRGTTDAD